MTWSTDNGKPYTLPFFLGTDPGKSGAMVLIDKKGRWVESIKHTETERELWRWLSSFRRAYGKPLREVVAFAIMEKVHTMPKQGIVGAFTFGKSFGLSIGFLTASRIKWRFSTPQEWQGEMKCRTGGDKDVTKAVAERLWPDVRVTHAVADAALIAEYCRREWLAREEKNETDS